MAIALVLIALWASRAGVLAGVAVLVVVAVASWRSIGNVLTNQVRATLRLYPDSRVRLRTLDGDTRDGNEICKSWLCGPLCVLKLRMEDDGITRVLLTRGQQPPTQWRCLKTWCRLWRFRREA